MRYLSSAALRATLRRGVDFGMIRRKDGSAQTKHPTLFKAGAEKVAVAYGLCQRYHMESKLEDAESGFFFYAGPLRPGQDRGRAGVYHHQLLRLC